MAVCNRTSTRFLPIQVTITVLAGYCLHARDTSVSSIRIHFEGEREAVVRLDRAQRRQAWLERLERWTEIPLTVLAIALAVVLVLPHVTSVSPSTQDTFDLVDGLIWGVFVADFLLKVGIAPLRSSYVKRHWFDLVLIAVPFLRTFRVLRAFKSVRLLNLARTVAAASRVAYVAKLLLKRRGLQYVLLTALLVVVVCGALATVVEHDQPDSTIQSLSDGLWWATTTVTTVGYGDTYPKTAMGRGIGVALMLLGIALFGAITANLAAYFVEEKEDTALLKIEEVSAQLKRIEELIDSRPETR